MSLTNSISDLFALSSLRRAAEGGDPSAIKTAAAMFGSDSSKPIAAQTDPNIANPNSSIKSVAPVDAGVTNTAATAPQNSYATNMVPDAFGAPPLANKTVNADPFKDLTKAKDHPATATNFDVGKFKAI